MIERHKLDVKTDIEKKNKSKSKGRKRKKKKKKFVAVTF